MPPHLLSSEAVEFMGVNPGNLSRIHFFSSVLTLPSFRSSFSCTGICVTVSQPLFLLPASHPSIQSPYRRHFFLENEPSHISLKVLYITFLFPIVPNLANKVFHLVSRKLSSLIYLPLSYWNLIFLPPRVLIIP